MTETVTFTLNGQETTVEKGLTIWEAANGRGLVIPHLCHKPAPGYRPDGKALPTGPCPMCRPALA